MTYKVIIPSLVYKSILSSTTSLAIFNSLLDEIIQPKPVLYEENSMLLFEQSMLPGEEQYDPSHRTVCFCIKNTVLPPIEQYAFVRITVFSSSFIP